MDKQLLRTTFLILIVLSAGTIPGGAQQIQPFVLITWQAESYAPSDFAGKVLPTADSPITSSVEVIENGKVVDLSSRTIYWYLDDAFLAGGRGLQRLSFRAPQSAGGTAELRVQLPDYRGGLFFKTIEIPVARPEAVIVAPFPDKRFRTTSIELAGRPYFFNVRTPSALAFSWRVNGTAPEDTDDPGHLAVNLAPEVPHGTVLTITLGIQNPVNIFEGATKSIDLTFVP